jgi:hypothetical protein
MTVDEALVRTAVAYSVVVAAQQVDTSVRPKKSKSDKCTPRLPTNQRLTHVGRSLLATRRDIRLLGLLSLSSFLFMPGSRHIQDLLLQPRNMHNLDPCLFEPLPSNILPDEFLRFAHSTHHSPDGNSTVTPSKL